MSYTGNLMSCRLCSEATNVRHFMTWKVRMKEGAGRCLGVTKKNPVKYELN